MGNTLAKKKTETTMADIDRYIQEDRELNEFCKKMKPNAFQEARLHCITNHLSLEATKKYFKAIRTATMDRNGMMTTIGVGNPLERGASLTYDLLAQSSLSAEDLPVVTKPTDLVQPKETRFSARWFKVAEKPAMGESVFGGLGTLEMLSSNGALPIHINPADKVPTAFLEQYGVKLVHLGTRHEVDFGESNEVLGLDYHFGDTYFRDYVDTDHGGGGFYFEKHAFPHIAFKLTPQGKGGYTVARQISDTEYACASFEIPFGYALIVGPNVMHDDSTLTGDYRVFLTDFDEDRVDTVLMRTTKGQRQPISVDHIKETSLASAATKQSVGTFFHPLTQRQKEMDVHKLAKMADSFPKAKRQALRDYFETLPQETLSDIRHLSDTAQAAYDNLYGVQLVIT